jgi:hypothetical protein
MQTAINPSDLLRVHYGILTRSLTTSTSLAGGQVTDSLGYDDVTLIAFSQSSATADTITFALQSGSSNTSLAGTLITGASLTLNLTTEAGLVKCGAVRLFAKSRYLQATHQATTGSVATSIYGAILVLSAPKYTVGDKAGNQGNGADPSTFTAFAFNVP